MATYHDGQAISSNTYNGILPGGLHNNAGAFGWKVKQVASHFTSIHTVEAGWSRASTYSILIQGLEIQRTISWRTQALH